MIVTFENVYKYFGAELLLKDINFTIEDKDVIGLIGQNGCGKSTLIKMILGEEDFEKTPDGKGSISVSPNKSIGYLEQNSGLTSHNTIEDEMKKPFERLLKILDEMKLLEQNMASLNESEQRKYSDLSAYFEANDGYTINVKIKTVLNGMGFADFDKKTIIDTLSGGEKTRLAMAKLLLEEPDLLILDEPTNHLDLNTLSWLEDYLKGYKGAILIVSHDRYFLNRLANRIFEIENKSLSTFVGDYSAYLVQREKRDERLLKEYNIQQKEIAKLEEYIAKNKVRASTANMAKSRQHMLDKIERIEKPTTAIKAPKITLEYELDPPKDVLTVKNCDLTVGEGDKKKTLNDNVSFEVKRSEKVAIIGKNGTGKTSILRLIQNIIPHTAGEIEWANNVKIAYFEQEHKDLGGENTVIDEIHNRFPRMTEASIRKVLGSVLLTGEDVFKKVSVLSGGEKAKLAFALLTLLRGNVLVLDEPTNHLDLTTKEVLEKALVDFEGTIILVSHDRYLLNKIATRIIELDENGLNFYNGNYDFYKSQIETKTLYEQNALKEAEYARQHLEKKEKASKAYRTKEQRANDAKRRLRVTKLEKIIEDLESNISYLEKDISSPEICSDYEKLQAKCKELEDEKKKLDKAMEEWAELG